MLIPDIVTGEPVDDGRGEPGERAGGGEREEG